MTGRNDNGSAAHWFRPRRYGYGATPDSWQGWVATIALPLVCGLVAFALHFGLPAGVATVASLVFTAAAMIAFIVLVRRKTVGEWRWRWGDEG